MVPGSDAAWGTLEVVKFAPRQRPPASRHGQQQPERRTLGPLKSPSGRTSPFTDFLGQAPVDRTHMPGVIRLRDYDLASERRRYSSASIAPRARSVRFSTSSRFGVQPSCQALASDCTTARRCFGSSCTNSSGQRSSTSSFSDITSPPFSKVSDYFYRVDLKRPCATSVRVVSITKFG